MVQKMQGVVLKIVKAYKGQVMSRTTQEKTEVTPQWKTGTVQRNENTENRMKKTD